MNGQVLGLMKQRKEKFSSAQPLREKIVGELKEKAELGYLGIPRNLGSSGYAAGGQVGIKIAQGSMLRNTKNESRYVPSATQ